MIGYIDNFLTPNEVDWFNWYWKILPNKIDTGQRHRSMAYYDQPFFKRIYKLLQSRILPNEEITTVNLNSDYLPGGIHSDGYIKHDKDDRMGHTYLIPIKIDGDFVTIVFDKISEEAVTLNAELGLGNSGIVTYRQVDRNFLKLEDTPFNEEIYNEYLSHLDRNILNGLQVEQVQEWKVGRAMVWPRKNLHCSANFGDNVIRNTVLIATKLC
jgi:hypothetical protein